MHCIKCQANGSTDQRQNGWLAGVTRAEGEGSHFFVFALERESAEAERQMQEHLASSITEEANTQRDAQKSVGYSVARSETETIVVN